MRLRDLRETTYRSDRVELRLRGDTPAGTVGTIRDEFISSRARKIASDYDHDRPAIGGILTMEQYARWWCGGFQKAGRDDE